LAGGAAGAALSTGDLRLVASRGAAGRFGCEDLAPFPVDPAGKGEEEDEGRSPD